MVNDISVLNEWWLKSMPIPMEPQRQAIGNLNDLKSHCGPAPICARRTQKCWSSGELSKLLAGSLSVERASWKAVWERAGRKFELTSSCSNSFHASACLRETESESAFFPSDSFYITIYKSAFLPPPTLSFLERESKESAH